MRADSGAPIAVGGLPEGIQPLLVGTHAAVAFGQHEVELGGELGIGSQDRPGHLDPGDRLGPLLRAGTRISASRYRTRVSPNPAFRRRAM